MVVVIRHSTLSVGVLSAALSLLVSFWSDVSLAQETAPSKSVTCQIGAAEGARRYRPGYWSLVEVFAVNRTDKLAEAEAVLRFVDDPTLQYARHVVVPPNSTLRTTCPILVPEAIAPNVWHVNCLTNQVLPSATAETKKQTAQDAMLASQPVILDREAPAVGLIADMDSSRNVPNAPPYHTRMSMLPGAPDEPIYELVMAAKRAQNQTRRVSVFEADDLPGDPAALAVMDVLALSTDRVAADAGGIALVRDWVLDGGHLWIMLDEVRPETVSALLGDAFTTTIVDRVGLTHVRIQNARYETIEQPVEDVELEEPVTLVRAIPDGVTITATVDGWPVGFWQPLGAGRVYFTTLSTAAWMRPTTWRDPQPLVMGEDTNFFPRQSLADFAADCLLARPLPPLGVKTLQPVLTQQIGYRILSQSAVMAILGGMCLVIAGAGLWFLRTGRLEHLLWMAPVAAAATSVVFLAAALVTKRSVPPTTATIAHVVFEPGLSTAHSSGLAAMYNPDASQERLAATRGGLFFPDMTALTGRHRRLVFTDEGAWHWESLELPAGVRTAPFARPMPLTKTVNGRARFGPKGLEGSLESLPLAGLEDAIIALPHQNAMAVTFRPDGTFTSQVDDVLARNEFLAGSWLDDRQLRHKMVYEQLFKAQPDVDAPDLPILCGWTDAADTGFVFPQNRQTGSTLVSMRLRLESSPPGTTVAVAAPFVPYRAIPDADGRPPVAYSNIMRAWVDSKLALTEWLQFELPREVLPIKLSRARLSLTARVPSRTLEVLALAGGEPVVVLNLSHPMGTYSCTLDRPEMLQLDDAGQLKLAIRVGRDQAADPREVMSLEPWTIHSLQMDVVGTVLGD
jgi:hypothetical protein